MANDEDVARLRQGVAAWNSWRAKNRGRHGADYGKFGANIGEVDLRGAKKLWNTDLSGADLSGADLRWANLRGANLSRANLREANLSRANLSRANLFEADLRAAILIETRLLNANLTRCGVHGIAAWGLELEGAIQRDLVITRHDEPEITVDNLEVAQFIYLLLHNEKIRSVIDTITSKAVLILGRFTPEERIAVLDALREELRRRDYLPILFDFDKPRSRTTLETVSTLAHMARFVIADITDAKSVLQELQAVVPNNPSVPVQPLLLAAQEEPGMFDFFRRFPWVLDTYYYPATKDLLPVLADRVIAPAETKVASFGVTPGSRAPSPFP